MGDPFCFLGPSGARLVWIWVSVLWSYAVSEELVSLIGGVGHTIRGALGPVVVHISNCGGELALGVVFVPGNVPVRVHLVLDWPEPFIYYLRADSAMSGRAGRTV